MHGKHLPPMHTDRTLRFDILEQKDTILRSTVDRRNEVSWFICPKNNGSIYITNSIRETKATDPIGMKARSKPPKFSPISLNAGHTGNSSSFSPSNTARYPVSPPKNTFTSFDSTTHEDQSVLNRSRIPRPVKCWQGVQVNLNSSTRGALVSTALGRFTVMFRLSHQSRQWKRSAGIPIEEKYSSLPNGAKKWICGCRRFSV